MTKKLKKTTAMFLIVFLLCISVFPVLASAASVLDAGGVLLAEDSSGEIEAIYDSAVVDVNGSMLIFSSSGLSGGDTYELYYPGSSETVSLSYVNTYDSFSVFTVADGTSVTTLDFGVWSAGSDTVGVMYYDVDNKEIAYYEATVMSESDGIIQFSDITDGAVTGAPLIDTSTGAYVGMLVKRDSSLIGITTSYMANEISNSSGGDTGSGGSGGSGSGGSGGGDTGTGGSGSGGDPSSNTNSTPAIPIATLVIILLIGGGILAFVLYSKSKKNNSAQQGNDVYVPVPADDVQTRLCIAGEGGLFNGQKFAMDGSITIGRQAGRCNICYPPDTRGVSGMHCQLRQIGNQIELIDLGSSYGTFVNGQKIIPNMAVRLNVGDRFWLASETNTFVVCR